MHNSECDFYEFAATGLLLAVPPNDDAAANCGREDKRSVSVVPIPRVFHTQHLDAVQDQMGLIIMEDLTARTHLVQLVHGLSAVQVILLPVRR